jgi:predicted nucleic acid-binding protein
LTATLVDANVLFDFLTEDEDWFEWSSAMLEQAGNVGSVVINQIVYAELSVRYATIEQLDDDLSTEYFVRASLPWQAAFLAGKAFADYKRRAGTKRSPMPDFYIGAHAAVADMTLLTRDPRRYRAYFPKLRLISP